MRPYKEQVAIITGAASGLGIAIEIKLAGAVFFIFSPLQAFSLQIPLVRGLLMFSLFTHT